MCWYPQVAHTAAVEVRASLTVESPMGGVQHMGDPQLPQLKAVICCHSGKGRKEMWAGCGLGLWLSIPELSVGRAGGARVMFKSLLLS